MVDDDVQDAKLIVLLARTFVEVRDFAENTLGDLVPSHLEVSWSLLDPETGEVVRYKVATNENFVDALMSLDPDIRFDKNSEVEALLSVSTAIGDEEPETKITRKKHLRLVVSNE